MSRTLTGEASHETAVKNSRFIARAAPCDDETSALAFIEQAADSTASHNCWAFRIGEHYRFSDDGEPGGTAGRPILQAINGRDMDRVVVLVTRHFGGVKLGTGGLARAYGGAAAEALRNAPSEPVIRLIRLCARLPFEHVGAAHRVMDAHAAEKLDETYDADGVSLVVSLPEADRKAFTSTLRDLARGDVTIRRI